MEGPAAPPHTSPRPAKAEGAQQERRVTELPALDRLDLRWNPLEWLPGWLADLDARGCLVHV